MAYEGESMSAVAEPEAEAERVIEPTTAETADAEALGIAREAMEERHGDKPFHNPEHPEHVWQGAQTFLHEVKRYGVAHEEQLVTDEDYRAAILAAAFHDTIIEAVEAGGSLARMRGFETAKVQFFGEAKEKIEAVAKLFFEQNGREWAGNEGESWRFAEQVMDILDEGNAEQVYTENVRKKVKEAIAATLPEVTVRGYDPEELSVDYLDPEMHEPKSLDVGKYLTMKDKEGRPAGLMFGQNLLKEDSAWSTVAVAFGDLMYPGMASPEEMIARGNEEFRESKAEISRDVALGLEALTPERKATIAKEMLDWEQSQVGFILGQKIRCKEFLDTHKEIAERQGLRDGIEAVWRRFDENLVAQAERVDRMRGEDGTSGEYGRLLSASYYESNPEMADDLLRALLGEMGYENVD